MRRPRLRRDRAVPPDSDWTGDVGPPDFVGVGVQKAGTSWWFKLITLHPAVAPPQTKELHYFDSYWERPFGPADVLEYHRRFPNRPGVITGEWTPRYMFDVWTPPLLARAAPDARLIAVLRDPVDRYASGLTHSLTDGAPRLPYVPMDAFLRGLYAQQLQRLLTYFDRTQLLVLQYERCVRDPSAELRRTWAFLGLPEHPVPDQVRSPENVTAVEKAALAPDLVAALDAAYRPDISALATSFPEIDLDLWPSARRTAS